MEGFLALITYIELLLLLGNGWLPGGFVTFTGFLSYISSLLDGVLCFLEGFPTFIIVTWLLFLCVFSDVQWGGTPGKKISCGDYIQIFSLFEFYEVKMGLLAEIILKFPRNLWVFFTLISWCWKRVDVSRALTSEWFSLVHFLLDFESWLVTSVLPLPVPHNPRSSLLFEVSVVGWWLSHWRWLLCVHDLPQVVPKAESSVARKGPRYDSGVSHLGYGCWIASQAEYPLNYYQEATSDMY